MAFNLGFQTKFILKLWCIIFHPMKVPLKVFSISFKIYCPCCVTDSACMGCNSWAAKQVHYLPYLLGFHKSEHSQLCGWYFLNPLSKNKVIYLISIQMVKTIAHKDQNEVLFTSLAQIVIEIWLKVCTF